MKSKIRGCTHGSARLGLYMRVVSGMEEQAMFLSEVKGFHLYDIPLVDVAAGLKFRCELELFNVKDPNSICLKCKPFDHLAT